jgi:hypothetical protein
VDVVGHFLIFAHTTNDSNWGPVTAGISAGWTVDGSNRIAVHSNDNILAANNWHHVVVTYNGSLAQASRLKIYVNGIDQTATGDVVSIGTLTDISVTNTWLGHDNSSVDPNFNGLIDDVRIYNRALSADEIKRLYKIGATAKLGVVSNSTSLNKGLVGWWNFDGKTVSGTRVFDASGNGNYGTMTNGPTLTEGKLGQGMGFDGGDDYATLNKNTSFNISQGTVSVWVYAERDGGEVITFGDGSANGDNGFEFAFGATGKITPKLFISGVFIWRAQSPAVSFNTWHHVVVTVDGTGNKVFVDGIQQSLTYVDGSAASTEFFDDIYSNASTIDIGRLNTTNFPTYFDGTIDDIRIYNRALSADEVKRLYNMGR